MLDRATEYFGPKADKLEPRTARAFGLLWRRRQQVAGALVTSVAVGAIIVNGLFLQSGPHPAPIFAANPIPQRSDLPTGTVALPRPRPPGPELAQPEPGPRSRVDVIAEIQRELARRGFYDGAVDGVHGAKTDASIREFEQATGLTPGGVDSDAMLQNIRKTPAVRRSTATRGDPIADLIASSRRVMAIQRTLSDFGYGQVNANGVYSPETRAAIERFERDRKMPVTGQISEHLARELTAMTGRPL